MCEKRLDLVPVCTSFHAYVPANALHSDGVCKMDVGAAPSKVEVTKVHVGAHVSEGEFEVGQGFACAWF